MINFSNLVFFHFLVLFVFSYFVFAIKQQRILKIQSFSSLLLRSSSQYMQLYSVRLIKLRNAYQFQSSFCCRRFDKCFCRFNSIIQNIYSFKVLNWLYLFSFPLLIWTLHTDSPCHFLTYLAPGSLVGRCHAHIITRSYNAKGRLFNCQCSRHFQG